MSNSLLSPEIQKYLSELIRRKTISENSLLDQMLINYLCSKKIDEDYFHMVFPVKLESGSV